MKLDGGRTRCNTLWRLTLDCRSENRCVRLWTQRKKEKKTTTDPLQTSPSFTTYTLQTPKLLLTIQGGTGMFNPQTRWAQSTAWTPQTLSPLLHTQEGENNTTHNGLFHRSIHFSHPRYAKLIIARLRVTIVGTSFTLYHLLPIHFLYRWEMDSQYVCVSLKVLSTLIQ